MRILQIYDLSGANDGPGTQMARLRAGLEARGHEVRLLTSRVQAAPGPASDYEAWGTEHPKGQVIAQTMNLTAGRTVAHAIADFRPDVVHVRQFMWQLSPLILPPLRAVPSVYHICHYKPICPVGTKLLPDGTACHRRPGGVCLSEACVTWRTWPFMMAQLSLARRWMDVFDRVVVLSEAMRARLAAEGVGPATVVHNAVRERPARQDRAAHPLIAYAGRLASAKGVHILIRAIVGVLAEVPNARLLVAGDGPERKTLQRLVRDLDIETSVTFTGHLQREEMERRLDPAWVQVVPSLWDEPFGNVVTESMMRGVAVVASASGGISEIVRDGVDGVLVPPGDVDALGRALLGLLTRPARAEAMGAAGRRRVLDAFSEQRLVDRMEEIFLDVAGHRTV